MHARLAITTVILSTEEVVAPRYPVREHPQAQLIYTVLARA
jgi:hypothetical protein